MSDELRSPEGSQQAQQQPPIPTDASQISTVYTNHCRANFTAEELVLDFGLNPSMVPNPTEPVRLSHRIVMNFYTAKRLAILLASIIQHHENTFGVVEPDIQKRVRGPRPGAQQTGIKRD